MVPRDNSSSFAHSLSMPRGRGFFCTFTTNKMEKIMSKENEQTKACHECGCVLPITTVDEKLNFHPVMGHGGTLINVCTSCKTKYYGGGSGGSTSPFKPIGTRRRGGGIFV